MISPAPIFMLAGVKISLLRLPEIVKTIKVWIEKNEKHYICSTSLHGITESILSNEVKTAHNSSSLVTPDGMPIVWIGRLSGYSISRVPGSDLMPAVLLMMEKQGFKTYLFGSSSDVLKRLKKNLLASYPCLKIVGLYSPPFRKVSKKEQSKIVKNINVARPDIVWVALGAPKQELWMKTNRKLLKAPILIGVGAVFDFFSGTRQLAPRWIQNIGFEWFFRIIQEPRRLLKRYLKIILVLTLFIMKRIVSKLFSLKDRVNKYF